MTAPSAAGTGAVKATRTRRLPPTWWRDLVREARTPAEREAAYRLRYRVYVSEHGKPYRWSDHGRQRLTDPFDAVSHLLICASGDRVLGTIRGTPFNAPGVVEMYAAVLRPFDVAPNGVDRLALVSRCVVDPAARSLSRVSLALASAVLSWALESGLTTQVLHTATSLVPLLERLGWRRYTAPFFHEDSGMEQVPLVFHATDVEYLESIDSPLAVQVRARTRAGGLEPATFSSPATDSHAAHVTS